MIDPDTRTITVYRPDHPARTFHVGNSIDMTKVVPDWTLPVAEVVASLE